MNPYVEKLKHYLAENSPNYCDTDIHTLLEFLWSNYTECNPIQSDAIEADFLKIDHIFESLPWDENNLLFGTVCDLCQRYEKTAFLEGIHVGVRLVAELADIQ